MAKKIGAKIVLEGESEYKQAIANINAAQKELRSELKLVESQFAGQQNPYAAYLAGKIRLNEEEYKDTEKAVRWFQIAAEHGNHFAEYQLGKLYLYGKDVERDDTEAIHWLTASAEHGNRYAAQLLHSIHTNRNWSAAMGTLRLLHHISRILQSRLEDERRGKGAGLTDRKLRRQIEEKKQAHGLKRG